MGMTHFQDCRAQLKLATGLPVYREVTEAESYKEDVLYFKTHPPEDYGLCMVQEWLVAVQGTREMVGKTGDMHVV